MRVLLTCQTATNKGDRAIAEYLISKIMQKGHQVTLSTTRPELWDSAKEQNVRVIGVGYKSLCKNIKNRIIKKCVYAFEKLVYNKMLFSSLMSSNNNHIFCNMISGKFIEEIKSADLVIVTGGHHITSIREKNALFHVTYDIGLISLYAKKYVLWSQTIGPLEFTSNKAKTFFGNVIKNADKVYIRDENSADCINNLYGMTTNIIKTYDSVFGFGDLVFNEISQREKKVGIAIFDGLKKAFDTYKVIAKTLDYYAEKGYEIEFFRMEYNDLELSNINKIIGMMSKKSNIKIYPFLTPTRHHLEEVSSCRYFIGYKTHSVIMALTTATPLIAIAYHVKTNDFMKDYGLEQYAVSDDKIEFDDVLKKIITLENQMDNIYENQKKRSYEIACKVENDLLEILENE